MGEFRHWRTIHRVLTHQQPIDRKFQQKSSTGKVRGDAPYASGDPSWKMNKLCAKGYEVGWENEPLPDIIPNPETHRDNPTCNRWGWDFIDSIKSAINRYKRDRLSRFGEKSLRGLPYLVPFCFFLPKFYIESVFLPHKNSRIKGGSLSFEDFLHFVVLCLLVTSHPGYNRRFFGEVNWYFWRVVNPVKCIHDWKPIRK